MNRWVYFKIFLPVGMFYLKLFYSKHGYNRIDRWLIEKNNKFVLNGNNVKIKNVFLLLSHCLQFDECEHRIIKTIENCAGCGKCIIKEIVKLGKKYNIIIKVATGGRLAKRLVEQLSPDMVVAVACENELVDGINAVYPVNVYGISNIRPNGHCINTTVDVDLIDAAIDRIINSTH